ncbi:MAG: hypothetical protein ACM33T_12800 [Solirubrobacterales bacterium]
MIRPAAALLLAMVAALPQAALAQGKAKQCLTSAEAQADRLVRHGVFLREAANRCDEIVPGLREKWTAFDKANGPRLRQQTERRMKVFQREFKDEWKQAMTYFDARLVTYHRHMPLTKPFCDNVAALFAELDRKGWGALVKQSKAVQDQVTIDYKVCQ